MSLKIKVLITLARHWAPPLDQKVMSQTFKRSYCALGKDPEAQALLANTLLK